MNILVFLKGHLPQTHLITGAKFVPLPYNFAKHKIFQTKKNYLEGLFVLYDLKAEIWKKCLIV